MRYALPTLVTLAVLLAPVAVHAQNVFDYGDTLYTDGATTPLDDASASDAASEAPSFDSLEMLAQPTTASTGYATAAPGQPQGPGMGVFRGFLLGTSSYEVVTIGLPRASADGSSQGGFLMVGDTRFALTNVQTSQGSTTVTTGDVQVLATFAAWVVAPSRTTSTAEGVLQGRVVVPATTAQERPGPGLTVVFEGSLQLGEATGTVLALPGHGGPRGPRPQEGSLLGY
jgi:hypothetical protein